MSQEQGLELLYAALATQRDKLRVTDNCIRALNQMWVDIDLKRHVASPEVREPIIKLRSILYEIRAFEHKDFLSLALCLPESEALQRIREEEYKDRFSEKSHIMDLLGEGGTWETAKEDEFRGQIAKALGVDKEKLEKEAEEEWNNGMEQGDEE